MSWRNIVHGLGRKIKQRAGELAEQMVEHALLVWGPGFSSQHTHSPQEQLRMAPTKQVKQGKENGSVGEETTRWIIRASQMLHQELPLWKSPRGGGRAGSCLCGKTLVCWWTNRLNGTEVAACLVCAARNQRLGFLECRDGGEDGGWADRKMTGWLDVGSVAAISAVIVGAVTELHFFEKKKKL